MSDDETMKPPRPVKDMSGLRFGRLVVVRRDGSLPNGPDKQIAAWACRCDCGGFIRAAGPTLRRGARLSCGCIKKTQGGLYGTPEHSAVMGMVNRCYNKNARLYHLYGARGISVTDEWRAPGGVAAFIAAVGPKPGPAYSIDRINNDGNYEPGNVRWATSRQQNSNKRTNRVLVCLGTFSDTIAGWARVTGIPKSTIRLWLSQGRTPDEIFLGAAR